MLWWPGAFPTYLTLTEGAPGQHRSGCGGDAPVDGDDGSGQVGAGG